MRLAAYSLEGTFTFSLTAQTTLLTRLIELGKLKTAILYDGTNVLDQGE